METSWPGPFVSDCREEEINTPWLKADGNQEVFDFTPSPFSIKGAWILIQARWFLGVWVNCFLSLLVFQIKQLFLAPTTCLPIISLLRSEQYELKLGNKFWWSQPGAL